MTWNFFLNLAWSKYKEKSKTLLVNSTTEARSQNRYDYLDTHYMEGTSHRFLYTVYKHMCRFYLQYSEQSCKLIVINFTDEETFQL